MIIFRRIEDKLYLAKDKYTPSYIIVSKIRNMLAHKWIESEKAQRDLGGAALVDWILKYDNA